MFSEPDNYNFGMALQGQPLKYNWTNTATIFSAVEKSHETWKTGAFDQIYFRKNVFKTFHKICWKEPLMKFFIYLSHSLVPSWKRAPSKVLLYNFCKVFQNSYSLEHCCAAVSERIACKTKTEWIRLNWLRISYLLG